MKTTAVVGFLALALSCLCLYTKAEEDSICQQLKNLCVEVMTRDFKNIPGNNGLCDAIKYAFKNGLLKTEQECKDAQRIFGSLFKI